MFNRKNRIENMDSYVEERLSAYLDGTLSAQERALVENYLTQSQEARASLESLRYTVDLLKQTPAPALPRQFTLPVTSRAQFAKQNAQGAPSWLVWSLRGVAVAATAAFVILLTATLLNQPNNLQTANAPSAAAQPSIIVAYAQTPLPTLEAPAAALESSAATASPLMITVPAPTETQELFSVTTTPEPQPTSAPAQAQAQDAAPASAPEPPTESAITAITAPSTTPDDTVARSSAAGSAPSADTSIPASPTAGSFNQRKVTTQEVGGIVTTDDLRVRRGPSTEYNSLGLLKRDERLIVVGRSLNSLWLVIRYPKNSDTGIGWVGARFVRLTAPVNTLPIFEAPPFIRAELTPTPSPTATPTPTQTPTPTTTETPPLPLGPANETSEPAATPTSTGN